MGGVGSITRSAPGAGDGGPSTRITVHSGPPSVGDPFHTALLGWTAVITNTTSIHINR